MSTSGRLAPLTRRLVTAQVAVIVAMTLTMLLAAALIAPAVFDGHMREAGHGDQEGVLQHAQEAFRSAGSAAIAAGVAIAALGAVLSSVLLTRRIGHGLDALVRGAERVARGQYQQPVETSPSAPEIDAVAHAFNDMAAQIAGTEQTRRRMLTDLSHEMRTPIAAIEITLEAVEDGVVDWDSATIATLRDQTHRLARLAQDIKDVSAAEEGHLGLALEAVTVESVIEAALSAARPAYQARDVRLSHDLTRVPPEPVRIDPSRIGQILDNLLRNALQHCGPADHVRVTVQGDDDGIRIEVSDTGAGIEAHHRPHIFERFYRADVGRHHDTDTGAGVGLAISRAIAQAHQGTLTAYSDGPGRGATFTLRLPR